MLYVLPPPRAPDPPSPWDSIMCGGSNSTQERSTWSSNKTHPPKIRLREFQIPKREDSSSGLPGDETDTTRNPKSLSECYFAGKGTALVLPAAEAQKSSRPTDAANGSNIQKHLQSMFYLLRPEETLKMAVKLESVHPTRTRYLVVVSRMGQHAEESCLLGIDCNDKTTVGLVLKVMADTAIRLDGDGGFSVNVCGKHHIFKPVSVQAMWSALQTLHKVSSKAFEENYFQSGGTHAWVNYYEERIKSDRSCINEWNAMDSLESRRPPSPDSIRTKPMEREETEKVIRTTLKEIMMSVDLDEVTSKDIRIRLEVELDMNLDEYKSFIDQEMLTILGQMDAPTEIFEHVYLGSEWNASNYEELQRNGVGHILNVTREIDNFFPGTFNYLNIRVYDDEKTDLLKHWDNTFKYITKARNDGSKVLVHCKMGVSRSASVVIAYAMKAYDWDFQRAMKHVKEKRSCIKPNSSFMSQLETYQGILDAMKNKEKLQRSKSETNLKTRPQVKNDAVRTGNEPPPVTESFVVVNVDATSSGQDLRQIGVRPKSWSPDVTASITDPQNVFLSLENLNQRVTSKDSLKSLRQRCLEKNQAANLQNRNVLLPCDNGESYSVSPNQIRHLPGQHFESEHTSVKDRVNELEAQKQLKNKASKKKLVLNVSSNSKKLTDGECKETIAVDGCALLESSSKKSDTEARAKVSPLAQRRAVKNETWDPGERNNIGNSNKQDTVCDCKPSSLSDSRQGECGSPSSATLKPSDNDKVPDANTAKSKTLPRNGDPFSNVLDRVFDKEERKQQRISVPILPTTIDNEEFLRDCPSRQNSWSSYDSAVVLGYQGETRDAPSRHSSWGSGDTRALASRNSSFGSYDMRQSGSTGYVNEKGEKSMIDTDAANSGTLPYEKEIPWYPGTVKRTKQKLEECAANKKQNEPLSECNLIESKDKSISSDTLTSDYPSSILSQNEQTVEAFNTVLIEKSSDRNASDKVTRTASMPSAITIKPSADRVISRLSVSAPETSSMDLIPKEYCSLSRSVSNVSTVGKRDGTNPMRPLSTVKKYRTVLEGLIKNNASSKKSSLDEDNGNISGLVRSRKKEFEAKTINSSNERLSQSGNETYDNNNKKNKVNSLPSSPISAHVDKETKDPISTSSDPGEDVKLRRLIVKFEYGDTDGQQQPVNMRPKQQNKFSSMNNRNSYIDATFDKKNCVASVPLISNFNRSCGNDNKSNGDVSKQLDGELKRPPVGPALRNSTHPTNVVVAATKSNKKQLQYGKTHPLARLNTKPRHNNTVYNTM